MRASLAFLLLSAGLAQADDTRVDLALVLAVDVSTSIGRDEQDGQRQGYIAALRDGDVIAAMTAGPHGAIALSYIEWADADFQRVVIPWTRVSNPEDAHQIADALRDAPGERRGATSISAALVFAADYLARTPMTADRRVIDISGDGANNDGGYVLPTRQQVMAQNITINALPLFTPKADMSPETLTAYYRDCVMGGLGAFTHPAVRPEDFGAAIKRKMIVEIAGTPERLWTVAANGTDCRAGERKARDDYLAQLNALTHGNPDRWLPDENTWPTP